MYYMHTSKIRAYNISIIAYCYEKKTIVISGIPCYNKNIGKDPIKSNDKDNEKRFNVWKTQ